MFRKYKDSQIIGLIVSVVGLLLMVSKILDISIDPVFITLFGFFIGLIGYIPIFKIKETQVIGVAISASAQKELDYLYAVTGFTAHKVDAGFNFNGHMKMKDDPEAVKIENMLIKYASCGYVFTKENMLIGKISTITSKEERVKNRRSNFVVINGFKE